MKKGASWTYDTPSLSFYILAFELFTLRSSLFTYNGSTS